MLPTLPVDSVKRADPTRILEAAYRRLDPRQRGSEDYARSVLESRRILESSYRGDRDEVPRTVAVGHAHIDLAWLWPVAQTRRKGARTFALAGSSVWHHDDHGAATGPGTVNQLRARSSRSRTL